MSFAIGDTVSWRGTLAMVVSDQTIGGVEYVGVVPLQGIQYVPANQLNVPPAPPPTSPPVPAPIPATTPAAPPPPPSRPGR